MPLGDPFQIVPKSAWSPRDPHDAMSCADAASTGAPEMSAFHALSAGKGRRPARLAFVPPFGVVSEPATLLVEHEVPMTSAAQTRTRVRCVRYAAASAGRTCRAMNILDVGADRATTAVTIVT